MSADVGRRWRESSTIEVDAVDLNGAQTAVAEAMAVLRFLLREVVTVNVDAHRIGVAGEVDRVVREYLVIFDDDRVAPGWTLVEGPVPFRFTDETLSRWDGDDRVSWLSEQSSQPTDRRSLTGRRVLTALGVLDRAFLATDPVVRVALYAVAIEVLLGDLRDDADSDPPRSTSLRIAARAAFLTCGNGCAVDKAACPYVLGFRGRKHLWVTAEQWAAAGEEWRCSAFLEIARPPDMDAYFKRPSLFGARNEAVHEGRTSLGASDIGWMRVHADQAVRAVLRWIVQRPSATLVELDAEIAAGAARLGRMTPNAS